MSRTHLILAILWIEMTIATPLRAIAQASTSVEATGLIFASKERFSAIPKAHPVRAIRSREADLSSLAPPVGNQGAQDSCVGWAVGYAARTIIAASSGGSASGPFSPSFIYNLGRKIDAAGSPANSVQDCNAGTQIETALGLLQGFGILPIKDFAYSDTQCSRLPTTAEYYIAKQYVISGWARAETREDVLQSIAARTPVIVGIKLYQSLKDYKTGIYKQVTGNYVGPHALVILGYSDDKHAYKIMNSWGTDKWEHGLAWVDYDTLDQLATVDGFYRAYILYPMKHN